MCDILWQRDKQVKTIESVVGRCGLLFACQIHCLVSLSLAIKQTGADSEGLGEGFCSLLFNELENCECVRMNHEDCESKKVLSNGEIFIGTFEGLLPHGMGKYTWLDGTIYEGQWEQGKMTGHGRICWMSGATYEGEFSGGFLHGFGTFIGVDSSTYTGTWRMNVQHGRGKKIYSNSDTYDGQWKEGRPEGIGHYTWNNGNTCAGNWKAGKMNGRGFMKWVTGDIFDGIWSDGLQNGAGYYRFNNGSFYFGTWSRGLKDGYGTFYPSGSLLLLRQSYPESAAYNIWLRTLCPPLVLGSKDFMKKALCGQDNSVCRWNGNCFLRNSGRMSHRRTTPDGVWDIGDPALYESNLLTSSCPPEEAEYEIQDENVVVYEREYMQGVLISERIRHQNSEVSQKKKEYHKILMKQPRGPGETIYKGHRSYYLMLNLQLGIRYTVGKITPVPMREVLASDFGSRARIRMYFPNKGSQFTPPHNSIDFNWKDYCPMVFRNLREMFKINAADYMMSICGGDGLKELSSPGKSGSIFYLSQDERFVIKTLRKDELKILLKMLPKYYDHVGSYDNTLITKFFGLHRLAIKGRKVRFVVMGNMFCTELRIHRRYDLKGSKHGRSTSKHKINENTTLKDLDLSYVFHLEKSWRESLFRQISLDCAFLESQSIIDYSMLLGLHFRAPEHLRLLEHQHSLQKTLSLPTNDFDVTVNGEIRGLSKGFVLVAHEPSSVSTLPGSHIRGSTLRASAAGNEEVDLLVPGTGRLRVQLGVNMPAQAHRMLLYDESEDSREDIHDVYDVVLYFGIIDILQQYNMTKRFEHSAKSLKFDPVTISAVEPRLYAKRFISFLEKIFPEA